MPIDYRESPLYAAAIAARTLVRTLEAKHDYLIDIGGSAELYALGRRYADAVHEYGRAVMEWLMWINKEHRRGERTHSDLAHSSQPQMRRQCLERVVLMAEWGKFVDLHQRAEHRLQGIVHGDISDDAESVLQVVWYIRAFVREAHQRLTAHCQQHGC